MGIERILVVAGGTLAMLAVMLWRRKHYPEVAVWKIPVLTVLLALCGVAGALLMYYVENGHFSGTSFFGALLFVPVLMLPTMLLRVRYGTLMDLCAPAECIMLAILKTECLLTGCCKGAYLPSLGFVFPSQIAELITILTILLVLVKIEGKGTFKNSLYGWYLILYGSTRFFLNWFRDGIKPFVWILPPGNFWGIISVCVGFIWIIIARAHKASIKTPR